MSAGHLGLRKACSQKWHVAVHGNSTLVSSPVSADEEANDKISQARAHLHNGSSQALDTNDAQVLIQTLVDVNGLPAELSASALLGSVNTESVVTTPAVLTHSPLVQPQQQQQEQLVEQQEEGTLSETEGSAVDGRRRSPSPLSSVDELALGSQRTAAIAEWDDHAELHPDLHPVKPKSPPAINMKAALACVAVGLVMRFVVPIPAGVEAQAWTLLAVFCSTIAGLVLEPMPVSAWSLTCVTTLLATKACTFQTAMSGLTNDAIWLIVFAFFFAKAFEKTGLGERVANVFVSAVGQSTLGLAYSLAIAETLMAPAMPSCTARAGGIFMPVIKFLAKSRGSDPKHGRKKVGAFLVHSQMQVSSNIAALFMTGAAQNLLAVNIARSMGVIIPDMWTTWAMGALVPGMVSVITIPLIMYHLTPPEVRSTPDAPAEARTRLEAMGPLSMAETITLVTLAGAVVLWMMGETLGVSAVLTAMIALSSLLVTGVLTWRDCLEYTPAWDTLMWFSVLMGMCSALATCGLVGRMADAVGAALATAKLPWLASFGLLHVVFFWIHYVFASQVGHVGALYGAFLAMMMAAGAPATLSALTLGYSANLFGSLTHYASGPAAVYHGSGYTRLTEVMKAGGLMALRSWAVWGTVGMVWWKILGWW